MEVILIKIFENEINIDELAEQYYNHRTPVRLYYKKLF